MNPLAWFLRLFSPAAGHEFASRGVKFVEGTRWLCPHCRKGIATAKRDIYHDDIMASSEWFIDDAEAFWTMRHCYRAICLRGTDGRILFFTPTGWVG